MFNRTHKPTLFYDQYWKNNASINKITDLQFVLWFDCTQIVKNKPNGIEFDINNWLTNFCLYTLSVKIQNLIEIEPANDIRAYSQ